MVPVVVATQPVTPRTILTPDMVRVQPMPIDAVHPQATHSVDEVVGKIVRTELTADEPVLSSKLFLQRAESGLAFMVPDGMRAISVGFTELIGSGGMVTPGDHVDVIGVFQANPRDVGQASKTPATPADANQQQQQQEVSLATVVLQDVPVLAVAQRLEGEDTARAKDQGLSLPGATAQPTVQQQQAQRAEPAPQPQAKTATLAVKPEDALKVVLAEEKGKIRLALRRANDTTRPQVALVPMNALLQTDPSQAVFASTTPSGR
jgi:pilus assembly protein CpaB